MNILILGNGFDIAHGLKTKYTDFLEYCANKLQDPFTYKSSDPYLTNLWIKHFLRTDKFKGINWIDLEGEIYSVLKFIDKLPSLWGQDYGKIFSINYNDNSFNFYHIDKYLNGPISINTTCKEYIRTEEHNQIAYIVCFSSKKGIINYLFDQLRDFTKLFEKYLLDEVLEPMNEQSVYQLSLKSIGVKENDKNVHVLSFNYTDTCARLYKHKFNTYCALKIKPIYVHGQALKNNSCELVLGTETFKIDPSKTPIPDYFNIFQKHYQRHKYQTIEPYQELIRQIKKSRSIPRFHIIGHSLDKTDHKILKHILQAKDDCIINIYFHNEEIQKILMDRINDIIGEDEVMSKVKFIHQHDDERSILKPKNQTT